MIFALEEDGVLRVYESPEQLSRYIEALDIETTLVAAFDEDGQPYGIEWLRPNRTHTPLGILTTVEKGEYRLLPRGDRTPRSLLDVLSTAVAIEPKSLEPAVRKVQHRLRAQVDG